MQASAPVGVLQEAAEGVERLSKFLKKSKTAQVQSKEEQQVIKATALAWFNNYRSNVGGADASLLKAIEAEYALLFECSSRATSRDKYQEACKRLKGALVALQSYALSNPSKGNKQITKIDFSPLVTDARMRTILDNRLEEITKCLECSAPLAATIMMGGLLEALFLAHVNRVVDKGPIFKAKAAPKHHQTGKVLPLNEWTLNSYIEVGAELGWITKPAKEIGIVLRNYRNFIHPERELSTGITLTPEDAVMFWSVSTQLAQQIIGRLRSMP